MVKDTERSEYLIWASAAAAALVAGIAVLFVSADVGSQRLRVANAKDQLDQLCHGLATFKQRNGTWPMVATPSAFLECLRGRLDARGNAVKKSWMLEGMRLYFKPADPTAPGAVIIDPWGRPYIYQFYPATGDVPEEYVLFSPGPDGKYSTPARWPRGRNGTGPEDADNIMISSLAH